MADRFNEKSLFEGICKTWGEHGAHADVYRALCFKAGISLSGEETIGDLIHKAISENPHSKIAAIKALRDLSMDKRDTYLDLRTARDLVYSKWPN